MTESINEDESLLINIINDTGRFLAQYNLAEILKDSAKNFIVNVGTEIFSSYSSWKKGKISGEEYIREIIYSGSEAAVTSGISAGILVPVEAALVTAGASSFITTPVAFIVEEAVGNIAAACFRRGKYKEILNEAKYYTNLENFYRDMNDALRASAEAYSEFMRAAENQRIIHEKLKAADNEANMNLKALYDSI